MSSPALRCLLCFMTRRPPRSQRTDTLFPSPTRCRSLLLPELDDEDLGAHAGDLLVLDREHLADPVCGIDDMITRLELHMLRHLWLPDCSARDAPPPRTHVHRTSPDRSGRAPQA